MKKACALILCLALATALISGCTKREEAQIEQDDTFLTVYASFYPLYAIAEMITRDVPDLELKCLVQPQDGCIRNYVLSDWDLALLINSADAILIGGRGLEGFESVLYQLGENGPGVSALLYNMELTGLADAALDGESHWQGENPHIYLKTDGAAALAERIASSLMLLDAENSSRYEENLVAAQAELSVLQQEIHRRTADLRDQKVILMNEAFLYTAEECGLIVEGYVERESGEAFYDDALAACLEVLAAYESKVILIEKQAPAGFCAALERAGYKVVRLDTLSTQAVSAGSEVYMQTLQANAASICAAFATGEEN